MINKLESIRTGEPESYEGQIIIGENLDAEEIEKIKQAKPGILLISEIRHEQG